jgi:L-histidine N-alpha-methyltransferase
MRVSAPPTELASDVVRGLGGEPKRLPPKYFYDPLGSSLFEAICRLPWYRITRAEHRLLAQHAPAIAAMLASRGGSEAMIVELGCGNGEKTARIGRAIDAAGMRADVHVIDVSRQALRKTRRRLRRFRSLTVSAHAATYEDGLSRARALRQPGGSALVLFLGSNIGNFDPADAVPFLSGICAGLTPGDFLLLGADLVKPEVDLLLAYDDPLGVTAAFNKNVLVRINRELRADFDVESFDHQARWNSAACRVEMHLVSRRAQRVAIRAVDMTVEFAAGESIWTESSYKYEPDQIAAMGEAAGFTVSNQWIEERSRFALTLFESLIANP